MAKLRALLVHAFIAVCLAILVIDGFPSVGLFHDRIKQSDWFDGLVDRAGIWQGGWTVFTPRVNRQNYHLEATIKYENGQVVSWRTPRWREISAWENLCSYREMKFGEFLSQDGYAHVRPDFAGYLARRFRPAGIDGPTKVKLDYHYFDIWPPHEGDQQPMPVQTGHWFVKRMYEGEVP